MDLTRRWRAIIVSAIVCLFSALVFGGLAFGLSNSSAYADTPVVPDRYDPARDDEVYLAPLPDAGSQAHYKDGYYLVEDLEFRQIANDDPETANFINVICDYSNMVGFEYAGYSEYTNASVGYVSQSVDLDGYRLILNGNFPQSD